MTAPTLNAPSGAKARAAKRDGVALQGTGRINPTAVAALELQGVKPDEPNRKARRALRKIRKAKS